MMQPQFCGKWVASVVFRVFCFVPDHSTLLGFRAIIEGVAERPYE